MVSRMAIIAIVGILAVPILLGYALNLDEVTETGYKAVGEEVNVTPLLNNGTEYRYTKADTFKINTAFRDGTKVFPDYETSNTRSSLFLESLTYTGTQPADVQLSDMNYYALVVDGYGAYGDYIKANIYEVGENNTETLLTSISQVHSIYYDGGIISVEYGNLHGTYTHTSNNMIVRYSVTGTFTGTAAVSYWSKSANLNTANWVDLSKGYHFDFPAGNTWLGETYHNVFITLPSYSRYAIVTIDLSSITEPNYSFGLGQQCYLEKTTVDDVVSWQVKPRPRISDNIVPVTDLYYDQNSTNNTYQVKIWIDPNGTPSDTPDYFDYDQHYEFRYIGAWQDMIGEANYFLSYDVVAFFSQRTPDFSSIEIGGFSDHSPTMRVDAAEFRAMEFKLITDQNYVPADFKENPMTTINSAQILGTSIDFGGNTYTVKNGNITLGTHQIPVKGLVLSSVPNPSGGYDNKIGDTVISTTAAPSAITFNGKWSASVSTIAQEEYEYTKTEWIAGGFAWNGMDDNFLIVGLITSVGMFIALGIYARRSRASVGPLMLVCGCAAALFFIML